MSVGILVSAVLGCLFVYAINNYQIGKLVWQTSCQTLQCLFQQSFCQKDQSGCSCMIVLVLFTPSRLDLEGLPNRCSTASMCALASDVNNLQQHTVCSKTPVQV